MSDLEEVYGPNSDKPSPPPAAGLKQQFFPWHHPVKHLVRDYQWADLTEKLLKEYRTDDERNRLRYFTLPGADLLDIRVLSKRLKPQYGTSIQYFGFDSGQSASSADAAAPSYLLAESELRQSGSVSADSEVLRDRLEDISIAHSQAANRLKQCGVFDVINIDACDHLGFAPPNRDKSLFNAIECLLAHQLIAKKPWLLFLTTRVDPTLLGTPGVSLQSAINQNIQEHGDQFSGPLAKLLGGEHASIGSLMNAGWTSKDLNLLKLTSVGLGKHILQFFHAQHNLPAEVELASSFAYRVHGAEPDMLSLAFRILPKGVRILPATAGTTSVVPPMELKQANHVVERAAKLWDIDEGMENDPETMSFCLTETQALLESANYDPEKWRAWLETHTQRPIKISDIKAAFPD